MKSLEANLTFRIKVNNWLRPLGYSEIWSHNHPTPLKDEIHYTIGRYRIICIKDGSQEFFRLHYDFYYNGKNYGLRTEKYNIGSDVIASFNPMNILVAEIPINKKSFFSKLKNLFF